MVLGTTVVKFHFSNLQLAEKRFSTERSIAKQQNSEGLVPLPFLATHMLHAKACILRKQDSPKPVEGTFATQTKLSLVKKISNINFESIFAKV